MICKRSFDAEPADLVRLQSGDVAPVKEHATVASGRSKPRNQVEKRGLAGAVWTDDGMQLRPGEAEAQIVDRGQAAKSLGQILAFAGSARSWLGPQLSCDARQRRRARSMRREPSCHKPTKPFGARITTKIAITPTINAWCSQWVDTISRMMMNKLVPTIGPNSVPAPPTIAHTTASPDT